MTSSLKHYVIITSSLRHHSSSQVPVSDILSGFMGLLYRIMRKEEGRKEGRKEGWKGRKDGRKEEIKNTNKNRGTKRGNKQLIKTEIELMNK